MHSGPTTDASLAPRALHAVADHHRIVLADHLAEVAGRREMVVQAAVGDEEHVAARNLAVDDAAHVDAGLADEIAAELDHDLRVRQGSSRLVRPRARAGCAPIGSRSSGFSPGKYGMPKPPPMFSTRTGAGAVRASSKRERRTSSAAPRRSTRRAGSASR